MTFSFVDLFAGCGGLSLGMIQSGARGILAVEKSSDAFLTLQHNLIPREGPSPFNWPKDIPQKSYEIQQLLKLYPEALRNLEGRVTAVVGGPPCQGFSMYGKRNPNDGRNKLFYQYLKFVDIVKPSILLIENVEGIDKPFVQGHKNGRSSRSTAASRIEKNFQERGYQTKSLKLCASNFGAPQYRPRFFMLGVRLDCMEGYEELFSDEFVEEVRLRHLDTLGLGYAERLTVRDAISDLENRAGLIPCEDTKGFQQISYQGPLSAYQRSLRQGIKEKDAPNSIRLARHKQPTIEKFQTIQSLGVRGYKAGAELKTVLTTNKHRIHWLDADCPSPTITTLPDDFVHYSEPRILTVRECARIQSFPDWFDFKGKYTTGGERRKRECPRFTQVGNAVPPRLAQFMGLYINEILRAIEAINERNRLAA